MKSTLSVLLRARFASFFAGMKKNPKTGAPRGIGYLILIGVLMAYAAVVFAALFFFMFYELANATAGTPSAWLYFTLVGVLTVAIELVGSIFATVTQLYEAKDNDLLLSMPIRPRDILLSRMLFLLLINVLFSLVVTLPALAAYMIVSITTGTFAVGTLLGFSFGLAVMPILGLTFSCFFGFLVALVLRRVKHKSMVQTVFMLLFLGAYFVLYFSFIGNSETVFENIEQIFLGIADPIKTYCYPFYLFGLGCTGSIGAYLLAFLCAAVPTALVFWLLSRSFIRIVTTGSKTKKTVYKEKRLSTSSVRKALAKKDLSHLLHSSGYLINAALGVFFLAAVGVALLFMGGDLIASFADPELGVGVDILAPMLAVGICFISSMNFITAPSISVEAKTLWLLTSSPLRAQDVLLGKVYAQLVMTLPASLFVSAAAIIVTKPSFLLAVGMILLPLVANVVFAVFGMILGVLFPKFRWISETEAVKSGIAVMLAMFGSMLYSVILLVLGLIVTMLLNGAVAVWTLTVFNILIGVLLVWLLLSPVSRKFESIQV